MNKEKQGYSICLCNDEDRKGLYTIFREVVEAGTQFPYSDSSYDEFMRTFFAPHSAVFVCKSPKDGIVGGFYIKPNFPGHARHIANAAYMIHTDFRGKGLGRMLGETSLHLAKEMGYRAMQYNIVFSQNVAAVTLWKKLGFEIIGTIADAIKNRDHSYQDGYIMYRIL
jgi:ribosomal protein S18 acetylase RimI-like enzyme